MKVSPHGEKDWRDPRLKLQPSTIHGNGHVATGSFEIGEIVIVFGGILFTIEDIRAGKANPRTLMRVTEDLWLGSRDGKPIDDDYYLNHSCDPNLWLIDDARLAARRRINAGEEVTMDYATHFDDPGWMMKTRCNCRSTLCRGEITGKDWMREDLQKRYAGHFTPYLNKRVEQLQRRKKNLTQTSPRPDFLK